MGVAIWSLRKKCFVQTYVISTENTVKLRYVAENNVRALNHLISRLRTIIGERNPREIVAEMPVGSSRNASAASKMALAFGAVVALCVACDVPLRMVSPFEVKRMVDPDAGRKSVPKEKVIEYISRKYGTKLLPKNAKREHVADAMTALDVYFSLSGRN